MTSSRRDRVAATSGALVVLGTLVTLVVTPPPPHLSDSAPTWTTYLQGHRHGLLLACLATSIAALALIGLACRLPSRGSAGALPVLAGVAAAAMLAGASVQAFLAQQSGRLGGGAVLALVGTSSELLYVVPAFAAAAFLAVAGATATGTWRAATVALAVVSGVAGVVTLLSTSAAPAVVGFVARLLFAGWAGFAGARTQRIATAGGTTADPQPAVAGLAGREVTATG